MSSSPAPPPGASGPAGPMRIFDRRLHAHRRARAAARFAEYSFLKQAAAEDIALRLSAINRRFDRVLDLGAHSGVLERVLRDDPAVADRIGDVVSTDLSPAFVGSPLGVVGDDPAVADRIGDVVSTDLSPAFVGSPLGVVADEEALPFADASFDLVVSALSLHWVNDLPGTLVQIRRVLKPDGLFVGVALGGRTLTELRQSMLAAEDEARGGAANRVSPFMDVIDAAGLLQRTGFAMPVADNDARTVRYANPLRLLSDLRGMGETAAFAQAASPVLTRSIVMRAVEIYQQRFSDGDNRVRATFEFVTLSGWAPSADQPRPRRPGSATVRLADALGVKERSAGEKTGR